MLTHAEHKRIKAQTQLAIRACGGQEACAEASARISRHQAFSEYGNMQMPDRVIALDTAAELDRFSGDPRFARLLAQLAGGVYVPLPRSSGRWDIEAAAGMSVREMGEVMIKLGESLRDDGELDDAERARLLPEIDDVLNAVVNLRQLVVGTDDGGAK